MHDPLGTFADAQAQWPGLSYDEWREKRRVQNRAARRCGMPEPYAAIPNGAKQRILADPTIAPASLMTEVPAEPTGERFDMTGDHMDAILAEQERFRQRKEKMVIRLVRGERDATVRMMEFGPFSATNPPEIAVDPAPVTVKERPTDADYERLFDALEESEAARETLSPTQERTDFHPPDPRLPVAIALPGDIHGGSGGVRYDLVKRDMELIRDTEGLYAVCMGDVVENTKPGAKSGSALYSSAFASPEEQIRYATLRLRIARGKWLALCEGNHDAWDGKWAGIDRLPALAADLGCPYFSEAGGSIICHVGEQRYVVVVKHEFGGASRINTTNAQRRAFDDFPQWELADVLACGHLHFNDIQQPPRKGGYTTYLRSGTYKTRDSYSSGKGFSPEYGVPLVILLPDRHEVIAFRGNHFEDAVWLFAQLRQRYQGAL